MLIQRIVTGYKLGMLDQAVALTKEVARQALADGIFHTMPRLHTSRAVADTVFADFEFESVEDMDARWKLFEAKPYAAEYSVAWTPLCDGPMRSEYFEPV